MATALMGLTQSTPGVTTGLTAAAGIENNWTLVDAHDHTSGKGAQIPSAGININADLSFAGFNLTNIRGARFGSQGAAFSGSSDNYSIYFVGTELYVRDGSGNNIALTASGSIAGTTGSISGLTSPASAAFGTNTFSWKSGSTTYGKMASGDLIIYPFLAAASNAITILADTSLAASYSLTLPTALPGATQYMSCTSGGALGFASADTIAAAMTSTGANAIRAVSTRSTGTTVAAGGVAVSSGSGAFTTSSASYVDVTNLSVTITTSGRPVFFQIVSDTSGTGPNISASGATPSYFVKVLRDATTVALHSLAGPSGGTSLPVTAFSGIDAVSAGTYTYKVQAAKNSATLVGITECKLIAFEL